MKLKECRLNPVFFVMNDKNRQKCAQCTFHSFLAAVVVWKFSAALEKKKPALLAETAQLALAHLSFSGFLCEST